jgi:hypothetical protein
VLGVRGIVRASDHLDGPRAIANPPADIADVFAFTSPENPSHVVLAMTVSPFASASSTFSTKVDYVFRIRRVVAPSPFTLDDTVLDVTCDFDAVALPQQVRCVGPNGLQASAVVGNEAGGGKPTSAMRAFAGLRSDPAFFDRQGALSTVASGRVSFTGQNAFAGANVLAIVVELDSVAAFTDADADGSTSDGGGAPRPILAVAAETIQRKN